MLKTLCSAFVVVSLAASLASASIIITVGDTLLQPNQANQPVPILVSSDGTPEVAAFNLVAQLAN